MRTQLIPIALTALALTGCLAGERRVVDRTQHTLDASDLDALRFDVGAGELDVVGDATLDSVEVTIELATEWEILSDDDAAIDALEVTLEEVEGEARLEVRLDDAPAGYFVDVVVHLPARLTVDGVDGSGDASIHDVAGLRFDDGSGDVEICRIAGATTVIDGSGELWIQGIDGDLEFHDASGEIAIENVNGAITLEDGSGDIAIEGVASTIELDDASGDIALTRIGGDVTIRDGSGDITVETEGTLTIESDGSGEVERR